MPTATTDPSLARLHLMRAGYLLMGVGLALVALPKAVWRTYVRAPGDRWR